MGLYVLLVMGYMRVISSYRQRLVVLILDKKIQELIWIMVKRFGVVNRGEILSIPVKYSKKHHGDMSQYANGTDTSYIVSITDDNRIRVILTKKGERIKPNDKTSFIGIDVNVKHNLFHCSNDMTIDYDRELVDELSKELLKIDRCKEKDDNYQIGKHRQKKINHLRRELKSKTIESMVDLCKQFNQAGIDHVVFEDLDNGFGRCFVKDENDLNFNRKVNELHLSSLKMNSSMWLGIMILR